MSSIRKYIGNNIRTERLARNISMEELAEMLELSPAFVGLIERGQRGASVKNLIKISNIFNITIDALIRKNDSLYVSELSKDDKLTTKRETIKSILFDFDAFELDFVISIIKNLRKLKQRSSSVDNIEEPDDIKY